MAIELDDIERLEGHRGNTSLLLRALQTVSLDACIPLYGTMRTPQHFSEAQRQFLQHELWDYQLPAGATGAYKTAWVLRVLQAYEIRFGRGCTELLIEWMSHCDSISAFGDKLNGLLSDVHRGMVKAVIPPRMLRYEALRELLTEPDDDTLDAVLLPENLQSEWDKHCWASNYWPEEDQNAWNPSLSVWWYIVGSGTRIAWETACRNPQVSTQELIDLHSWVMSNTRYPRSDLPRPETLFLPARLRAEYEERGLIPPER